MNCLQFVRMALLFTLATLVKSDFIRSCVVPKTIAITFDDGPWKYTDELLDYLMNQHPDVRVTFFQVGRFHYPFAYESEEYQLSMKRAHDFGYQIASHTFGHIIPNDTEEFKKSLNDMDDLIEKATGDRPSYFRAPKGHCYEECKANIANWGYRLIQWDTDPNDWNLEESGSIDQRAIDSISYLQTAFEEERDSYLVLLHDTHNYTVRSIAPWIFDQSGMKEKGYRFVTVAECLGEKDSMYVSGKTYGESTNLSTTTIKEDTTNQTEPTTETTDHVNISHNLESSALLSIKPLSLLPYLCAVLMASLLLSMN